MIVQLKADNKNIVFLDGSEEINANDDFVQSLIVLLETPLNANERLSVVFFNEESVTYELDMLVRNRQNDSCIVDIPQALINSGGTWNLKLLRHRQAYTGEKTTASNDYPFTVGVGVKAINGGNVTTAELQTAYNEIMQTRDEAQSLANTAGAAAASAQSAAETARQSALGASSAANYAETKATQATTAASEAAQAAADAEQARSTAAQILNTTDKLKSQAEKAASDADDAVNYINTTLRDVSKAKAFDDYGALVNHLLTAQLDIPYAIGQPFYLISTSVPDLWVSGVLADYEPYDYTTPEKFLADMDANGGKVRVGNYQLSKLETAKIIIDNAQEKYDENLETEDKTVVGAINELNEKKVGFTDYATADKAGVVKVSSLDYGVELYNGTLRVRQPSDWNIINARSNGGNSPVTLSKADLTLKECLKNPLVEYLDDDKAKACETIGALPKPTNTDNKVPYWDDSIQNYSSSIITADKNGAELRVGHDYVNLNPWGINVATDGGNKASITNFKLALPYAGGAGCVEITDGGSQLMTSYRARAIGLRDYDGAYYQLNLPLVNGTLITQEESGIAVLAAFGMVNEALTKMHYEYIFDNTKRLENCMFTFITNNGSGKLSLANAIGTDGNAVPSTSDWYIILTPTKKSPDSINWTGLAIYPSTLSVGSRQFNLTDGSESVIVQSSGSAGMSRWSLENYPIVM